MTILKTKHFTYYHDGERLLKKRFKKKRKTVVEYFESYLKADLKTSIEYVKKMDRTDQVEVLSEN